MKKMDCLPHAQVLAVVDARPKGHLFEQGLIRLKHFGIVNSGAVSGLALDHADLKWHCN
jgi:hypothetical protein